MFSSVPANADSSYFRIVEANNRISPSHRPPDNLNADGDQNLRVTAVYEYATPENVAKCTVPKPVHATSSIDFPVILLSEIATSVNALS
jgi:hypothetical protein